MIDFSEPDELPGGVPLAVWSDGSTVHSVVLADRDHEHEYWVIRDGRVLARCRTLAAVADWQSEQSVAQRPLADSGDDPAAEVAREVPRS